MKVKKTVYLHADRDSMWELGEELGFEGDVLSFFSYTLCEVTFEIEVDTKTGKSKILSVNRKKC